MISGRLLQTVLVTVVLLADLNGPVELVHSWEQEGNDECQSDFHCLNGGTCMPADPVTNFKHCLCNNGFSGLRCSNNCPLLCQNGGLCQRRNDGGGSDGTSLAFRQNLPTSSSSSIDPNDFECKCRGYFTGPLCEISYANCGNHQRCFNGGVCVYHNETTPLPPAECSCTEGFGGDNCQDRVVVLQAGGKVDKTWTPKAWIAIFLSIGSVLFFMAILCSVILSNRAKGPPTFTPLETTLANPGCMEPSNFKKSVDDGCSYKMEKGTAL